MKGRLKFLEGVQLRWPGTKSKLEASTQTLVLSSQLLSLIARFRTSMCQGAFRWLDFTLLSLLSEKDILRLMSILFQMMGLIP
ncbi:hypothetical protein LOK49_LG06G03399 [Camellia lanceoleosa]|uniref:Uncharacterized protein n=1 Tax=Camellia lanceoleosa TaxID=1840588 RepID=A0ACC0HHY4_9ERIC|nr:hypothetical protein LOK49_LG06G03399 [Camellia lanceoleosa]